MIPDAIKRPLPCRRPIATVNGTLITRLAPSARMAVLSLKPRADWLRYSSNDGIGFNAQLSGLDTKKVANFLKNHKNKEEFARTIEGFSPSMVVVDTFKSKDYFKAAK